MPAVGRCYNYMAAWTGIATGDDRTSGGLTYAILLGGGHGHYSLIVS